MRGNELVEGVLKEWENIVNRVARDTVGEKVIVCGRSVRWWDDEIKAKIEQRRQLYWRAGASQPSRSAGTIFLYIFVCMSPYHCIT